MRLKYRQRTFDLREPCCTPHTRFNGFIELHQRAIIRLKCSVDALGWVRLQHGVK